MFKSINPVKETTKNIFTSGTGLLKSYLKTPIHKAGTDFFTAGLGLTKESRGKGVGKFIGRWLGRSLFGYSVLTGLRDEGLWGGVKGAAEYAAWDYGIGVTLKTLGYALGGVEGALTVGAIAGTVGYATLKYQGLNPASFLTRPLVKDHMKKQARLELARPMVDTFGNIASMRQRSINAMQRSYINGRTALGNEAQMFFNRG